MAEKTLNILLQLRRDLLSNYSSSYVPLQGEVCLVDTPRSGLRVKYGDGITNFGSLGYADDVLITGYFIDGNFYVDAGQTTEAPKNTNRLYVDLANSRLYIYNGTTFDVVGGGGNIPSASAEVAGVLKLYDGLGDNIDGTMTQKAITTELNKKFEVMVEDEIIVFDNINL